MELKPWDVLKAFILGTLAYFGISTAATAVLTIVTLGVFSCMFACMLGIFLLAVRFLPYL